MLAPSRSKGNIPLLFGYKNISTTLKKYIVYARYTTQKGAEVPRSKLPITNHTKKQRSKTSLANTFLCGGRKRVESDKLDNGVHGKTHAVEHNIETSPAGTDYKVG